MGRTVRGFGYEGNCLAFERRGVNSKNIHLATAELRQKFLGQRAQQAALIQSTSQNWKVVSHGRIGDVACPGTWPKSLDGKADPSHAPVLWPLSLTKRKYGDLAWTKGPSHQSHR